MSLKVDTGTAKRFGENLRKVLGMLGVEGQALAKELHVKPGTVSRWLTGSMSPTPRTRRQLEEIFATPAFAFDGDAATALKWLKSNPDGGWVGHPTPPQENAPSAPPPRSSHSAPLSRDDVADIAAEAVGRCVRVIWERNQSRKDVVRFVLALVSTAQAQGVNDVKPLVDLARQLLYEDEQEQQHVPTRHRLPSPHQTQ